MDVTAWGVYRQDAWGRICRSAQSSALHTASLCPGAAAELILGEVRKLCNQPPPITDADLADRHHQASVVRSKIGCVFHSHSMGRLCRPDAACQMLTAAAEFCDRNPITQDVHLAVSTFQARIQSISFEDQSHQLRQIGQRFIPRF